VGAACVLWRLGWRDGGLLGGGGGGGGGWWGGGGGWPWGWRRERGGEAMVGIGGSSYLVFDYIGLFPGVGVFGAWIGMDRLGVLAEGLGVWEFGSRPFGLYNIWKA